MNYTAFLLILTALVTLVTPNAALLVQAKLIPIDTNFVDAVRQALLQSEVHQWMTLLGATPSNCSVCIGEVQIGYFLYKLYNLTLTISGNYTTSTTAYNVYYQLCSMTEWALYNLTATCQAQVLAYNGTWINSFSGQTAVEICKSLQVCPNASALAVPKNLAVAA